MSDDRQLLREYVNHGSEAAFTELVRNNINLVYSAALRLLNGDAHQAQDVTQQVFIALARNAAKLGRHPALAGWLYTTTRLHALRSGRTDRRRSAREQEVYQMNEILQPNEPGPDWERLRPALDDAMHELGEHDRIAVLLRYFQNKPLREVGAALGLKENAARMRVDRAIDKLRDFLARRGVKSSSAALAAALTTHAVTSAPSALASTIAVTSLAAASAAGGAAFSIANILNMTSFKISALAALVIAGLATPAYLHKQSQTKLREENGALREQLEPMDGLRAENERLSNLVAQASQVSAADLFKLRAEVGRLRDLTNEIATLRSQNAAMRSAFARMQSEGAASAVTAAPPEPLREAKILAFSLLVLASDDRELPADFTKASAHFDEALRNSLNPGDPMPDTEAFHQVTNRYEILRSGTLKQIGKPATTILVREREARQMPDGRWAKAYAFADGHAELHYEAVNNFEAFEKTHSE